MSFHELTEPKYIIAISSNLCFNQRLSNDFLKTYTHVRYLIDDECRRMRLAFNCDGQGAKLYVNGNGRMAYLPQRYRKFLEKYTRYAVKIIQKEPLILEFEIGKDQIK